MKVKISRIERGLQVSVGLFLSGASGWLLDAVWYSSKDLPLLAVAVGVAGTGLSLLWQGCTGRRDVVGAVQEYLGTLQRWEQVSRSGAWPAGKLEDPDVESLRCALVRDADGSGDQVASGASTDVFG